MELHMLVTPRTHAHPEMNTTKTTEKAIRGNIMLYGHNELTARVDKLVELRSKGKRGPKNRSQLWEQWQLAYITRYGRKYGISIPEDLA